jgi:peptidoglycan/xylan/chitin deacetylase (PgdA/CDA1 family)
MLRRVLYPWLANSGYLRRRADGGSLCVVTYHGVVPEGYAALDLELDGALVTPQAFRGQLRLLKKRYCVVSPDEVYEWLVNGKDLPERAVLLTCDDGLRNTLTDMVPILREEGLSCLFFVLGASVGSGAQTLWYEDLYLLLLGAASGSYSFETVPVSIDLGDRQRRRAAWWNLVKRLSTYEHSKRGEFIDEARAQFGLLEHELKDSEAELRRFSLLNRNELEQLVDFGMAVGAHTLSHPVLSLQNSEMAWEEISESRRVLQCAVGRPVWALAYPFGDAASVSGRDMRMAEQAGFQCAFMNTGGGFGAQLSRFALPRVHVTASMSLSEFEAHVSGFYRDFRCRLSLQTA